MVSMGFVQKQVWSLGRAAPHTLRHNAPSQQRISLPPAGGRGKVLPRPLFMTKPRKEGEEGEEGEKREEREKREKREERKERKKTEKQQQKGCTVFT